MKNPILSLSLAVAALCSAVVLVAAENTPPATSAPAAPAVGGARRHHAFFTQRFLPRLFFRESETVLSRAATEGLPFVVELWNDVGDRLGPELKLPPTGLTVETEKVGEQSLIVWITLPPARAAAEAYFVALVRKAGDLHYYTFERTAASDAPGAKAEAAAWTINAAGAHHDLGLLGPPTLADFKAAVRAHLAAGG